ncbi:sigma-70 family RNA polymerase sigma factor [Paenibacillus polymyxa]|uniref:RNA polymerase sigma factor n=1 Tax=Paenibacillus polymyxa TaxID=1406 RepID=UPI002024645B|nr:sigma-70 family RNA polymerase sigma factor [Paenibacillus polymyxa]URJ45485.1 sigma-70 family RNA polymerase sigma factor [Paenibacillus polymyxa]
MLSETETQKNTLFSDVPRSFKSDRIIQSFFMNEENVRLYTNSRNGIKESKYELEERFRKHFFQVRFITFLVNTIKYCTIDQLRNQQKRNSRFALIFDQPLSEEQETSTLGEMLGNHQDDFLENLITDPATFESSLQNESLAHAFSKLSEKQRLTITLRYALGYKDNEIARMLGVSAQAVGKTKNAALKKLKVLLMEGG